MIWFYHNTIKQKCSNKPIRFSKLYVPALVYITIIHFSEQVGKSLKEKMLHNSAILFTLIIIDFYFHHPIYRTASGKRILIHSTTIHNISPAESFRFAQFPGNRYFSLKYCITKILFLENCVGGNSTGDFIGISSTRVH